VTEQQHLAERLVEHAIGFVMSASDTILAAMRTLDARRQEADFDEHDPRQSGEPAAAGCEGGFPGDADPGVRRARPPAQPVEIAPHRVIG
jgi:hypothetical protein